MRVLSHPLQALKTIAIFAMAMSCTGCFWVPAETGVRMQADIRDLQNNMRAANKHIGLEAAREHGASLLGVVHLKVADIYRDLCAFISSNAATLRGTVCEERVVS